ncbi:hypothetical protein MST18_07945 [Acinetobacter sp. YH12068_T]|nr:hypothetical protein [Acinetobacter sp. YH12068_T]UUS63821.1 hypothetical protein MST18_07945 [Acinetobacter sp. YH12068_T]
MNRQEIDVLVKQMNVDTATGPVDQRVQQVVGKRPLNPIPILIRFRFPAVWQ